MVGSDGRMGGRLRGGLNDDGGSGGFLRRYRGGYGRSDPCSGEEEHD